MKEYGFIRVGATSPRLYLANPLKNAKELINQIKKANEQDTAIIVTPELSITGYTCGDLFFQERLLTDAKLALQEILEETKTLDIISILGMPIRHDNQLLNCAIVIHQGKILGKL